MVDVCELDENLVVCVMYGIGYVFLVVDLCIVVDFWCEWIVFVEW